MTLGYGCMPRDGYSSNDYPGAFPVIKSLEETFNEPGRQIFLPGSVIELNFRHLLESLIAEKTQEHNHEELEDIYNFLVECIERVKNLLPSDKQ